MSTVERIELIKNGKSVINELLKRVSDLEFEVEKKDKYYNALKDIKEYMWEQRHEEIDQENVQFYTIEQYDYIFEIVKKALGSDKE